MLISMCVCVWVGECIKTGSLFVAMRVRLPPPPPAPHPCSLSSGPGASVAASFMGIIRRGPRRRSLAGS